MVPSGLLIERSLVATKSQDSGDSKKEILAVDFRPGIVSRVRRLHGERNYHGVSMRLSQPELQKPKEHFFSSGVSLTEEIAVRVDFSNVAYL